LEPESRTGKRHVIGDTTIDFTVGDLKGLLAAAYDQYTYASGWGWDDGHPAAGFHQLLVDWLRGSHQAVVADVELSAEKWFHPLYKYEANMEADARDAKKVHVDCGLCYLEYGYPPETLTPIPPDPGQVTGHYWLNFNLSGGIVSGQWDGDLPVDTLTPPTGTAASGCGGATLSRVYEIISGGSVWP
jgi:hypothetical protein